MKGYLPATPLPSSPVGMVGRTSKGGVLQEVRPLFLLLLLLLFFFFFFFFDPYCGSLLCRSARHTKPSHDRVGSTGVCGLLWSTPFIVPFCSTDVRAAAIDPDGALRLLSSPATKESEACGAA